MILLKSSDKLKKYIMKSGNSYRNFAKKVNCSNTQISLILKGERNPSPKLANNICKVLDIEFNTIFFIKSDYKRNQKGES